MWRAVMPYERARANIFPQSFVRQELKVRRVPEKYV
jgi:hypothetical protein